MLVTGCIKSPLEKGTTPISPLTKGDRGGCKMSRKTQPLESPFVKGGLKD